MAISLKTSSSVSEGNQLVKQLSIKQALILRSLSHKAESGWKKTCMTGGCICVLVSRHFSSRPLARHFSWHIWHRLVWWRPIRGRGTYWNANPEQKQKKWILLFTGVSAGMWSFPFFFLNLGQSSNGTENAKSGHEKNGTFQHFLCQCTIYPQH